MTNAVFGEVVFNMGWETKSRIALFEKKYEITISASAYDEKEMITGEQEESYKKFEANRNLFQSICEVELLKIAQNDESARANYTPKMLVIQKDGETALLIDDHNDMEGGIAIVILPETKVESLDEYL